MEIGKLKRGIRNPLEAAHYLTTYPSTVLQSYIKFGTNIFEKEWDLLIILDTCRVDAIEEVSSQYPFLKNINAVVSVGGATPEWIANTFDKKYTDEISGTEYIVRSPWAYKIFEKGLRPEDHLGIPRLGAYNPVSAEEFANLIHVWRYYDRNPGQRYSKGDPLIENGNRSPRTVTDIAIDSMRKNNAKKYIVHYSRPHAPYIAQAIKEERTLNHSERNPWQYLRQSGNHNEVFEMYLENLKLVLDDVELLINSVNAEKVIITSDHGEAFGEYNVYSHPMGSLHPDIRRVPWVETSATNTSGYEPDDKYEDTERDVNKNLKRLGYLE